MPVHSELVTGFPCDSQNQGTAAELCASKVRWLIIIQQNIWNWKHLILLLLSMCMIDWEEWTAFDCVVFKPGKNCSVDSRREWQDMLEREWDKIVKAKASETIWSSPSGLMGPNCSSARDMTHGRAKQRARTSHALFLTTCHQLDFSSSRSEGISNDTACSSCEDRLIWVD